MAEMPKGMSSKLLFLRPRVENIFFLTWSQLLVRLVDGTIMSVGY